MDKETVLTKANELLEEVKKLNDPLLKKRVNDLIIGLELGSEFKRIDITFLEMTAEENRPRFAVLPYDDYVMGVQCSWCNGQYYTFGGTPTFRTKAPVKNFDNLQANPQKTIPETISAAVEDVRSRFDKIFIAWEAEWNQVNKDPIIFGEKRGLYYIIATFDLSEFESYVVDKFVEKEGEA